MNGRYLTLNVTTPDPVPTGTIKSKHDITLEKTYTVLSWNINGYSNDIHTWLLLLAQSSRPDIIFLSETKKKPEDLTQFFNCFTEYNYIINSHCPTNLHGVAMLIRKDHTYDNIPITMNISPRSDTKTTEASCGRLILINLNKSVYILGSYTPNSGRSDAVKYNYRTNIWDPAFFLLLEQLRNIGPVMWIGDINVALDDIDVSNPKTMCRYAGFTPQERDNFKSLLNTGNWLDIWRYQHPTDKLYTWCGNPPRANYGLRLDNIIISSPLLSKIVNTFSISECPLSADHIPIGIHFLH